MPQNKEYKYDIYLGGMKIGEIKSKKKLLNEDLNSKIILLDDEFIGKVKIKVKGKGNATK